MEAIGPVRTCIATIFVAVAAALLASCNGEDNGTAPPPGSNIRVMAEVERYSEGGEPVVDVSVVVSLDGDPVTGAEVTLNGRPVPPTTSGLWYQGSGLPLPGGRAVVVRVTSIAGDRTVEGTLPGEIALRQPQQRAVVPDGAPISVAWEAVSWDSVATPHEITVEFTQGNPFHFVTLPPDAIAYEVPASATTPSPMEFLVVSGWGGHADPGNPDRGDWLGQDGLRLGSRAIRWVEIAE